MPRAGRSGVAGRREGAWVIRLAAAPVDGAANAELVAVLAAALDIPRRDIALISGDRSRYKRLRVTGLTREAVDARLAAASR